MAADTDAIFDAAMKLPEPERLVLVTRLMDTLPPDEEGMSMDDPGLLEELDRRWNDGSKRIPWSEVRDQG